jgi:hypothetical protein
MDIHTFYINRSKTKLLEIYIYPLVGKPIIALRTASSSAGVAIKNWSWFSSRLSDISHFLTYQEVHSLYFTFGRGVDAISIEGRTRENQKLLTICTDDKAEKPAHIDLNLEEVNKIIVLRKCVEQKYAMLSSKADVMPSMFKFLCDIVARRVGDANSRQSFSDFVEKINIAPPEDLLSEIYALVPIFSMQQIFLYYTDAMYAHCAKHGLLHAQTIL